MMINSGLVDVLIVGGAEAPLTPSLFAAFDRLSMMPTSYNESPSEAARPFDIDREGPVLGEGAAILILESEEHARRRGGRLLAAIRGYGATCDASSHFHQEPGGDDAARAIEQALDSSGVSAEEIEYVNAHGTGTRENDPFESRVLRRALGMRGARVPVSSSKSQFGHLLGAAGAIEAAVIVAAMSGGFVPVTRNLSAPDPECDLAHVIGAPRSMRIDVALSTSFGFGSRNAALVLSRCRN
jgi:3-oxoacyl-[acyl-carrier-protein] synthase II